MFVLQGQVSLEGKTYGESVMYQPYSRVTKNITISCEAQLCGVRFHPGMQLSFFEELVEANKENHQDVLCFEPSEPLVKQLSEYQSHNKRIALLMDWCLENVSQIDTDIDRANLIPVSYTHLTLPTMRLV